MEVCGSARVVIGVRIVQCHHAIMDICEHVVIGVRVMHCHHAFMPILNFPLLVPILSRSQFQLVTCFQFQLVVILYELIVTFPCSHFCAHFLHRENTSFEVLYLQGQSTSRSGKRRARGGRDTRRGTSRGTEREQTINQPHNMDDH